MPHAAPTELPQLALDTILFLMRLLVPMPRPCTSRLLLRESLVGKRQTKWSLSGCCLPFRHLGFAMSAVCHSYVQAIQRHSDMKVLVCVCFAFAAWCSHDMSVCLLVWKRQVYAFGSKNGGRNQKQAEYILVILPNTWRVDNHKGGLVQLHVLCPC